MSEDDPTIGTHDGMFHADDVTACVLLTMLDKFSGSEIIRTRNPELLKTCAVVVDVGGVYDPQTDRYDHHQRDFAHSMSTVLPGKPWTTKLSSAGLVYAHYGHQIIQNLLETDDDMTEAVFDRLYVTFIEEIDAMDNGLDKVDTPFRATSTLTHRVQRLGPSWEDISPDFAYHFDQAISLVRTEFLQVLFDIYKNWLPARGVVRDAYATRFTVDGSGQIMTLPCYCPWQAHLSDSSVKIVLFPDPAGQWRIQGAGSFLLPVAWRGLSGDALSAVCQVPASVFVHNSGFMGGHTTYEGALSLARLALGLPCT